MNNSIFIKEVSTPKELSHFIRFPRLLYAKCEHYVPVLDEDERRTLTQHPALSFCDLRLWLAYQNDQIVGRIAGIINHKCNSLKQQRRIRFGWFDAVDNPEVVKKLIDEVIKWGKEKELYEISGPSRFSNMEKQGLLVEGFNKTPSISSEYNFAYYPQYIEQLGFQKEVDYIQYQVNVKDVPERLKKLNDIVAAKYKVKIKKFNSKKELKIYGKAFFNTLNESFSSLYNFIPLSEEEIDYHIKQNLSFANKELVNLLVDENEALVGFSFCLPSLSRAFQKANGKLFPFGIFHILRALRHNDVVDLYLTGVLPKWMNSGIHTLYHYQLNKIFIEKGYHYAMTNPQLEQNTANKIWENYDANIVFRRRCYVKSIESESTKND